MIILILIISIAILWAAFSIVAAIVVELGGKDVSSTLARIEHEWERLHCRRRRV